MPFSCSKCGLCCRKINGIPQLKNFDRGDGVCIHLSGNLCDIYENRPEICNTDKMYRHFFSSLSRDEYEKLLTISCSYIQGNQKSLEYIVRGENMGLFSALRETLGDSTLITDFEENYKNYTDEALQNEYFKEKANHVLREIAIANVIKKRYGEEEGGKIIKKWDDDWYKYSSN